MRPLLKPGKPVNYPYAIRVDTEANLLADAANYTFDFSNYDAASKFQTAYGTTNPTGDQLFDGLLQVAKAPTAPAKTKGPKKKKQMTQLDVLRSIRESSRSKLDGEYGAARPLLNQMLGRYCSFCEQYEVSGLAVEHVVPKAPFPLFYLSWDNFVLACRVCNGIKLSNPSRAVMDGWKPTVVLADEVERYDAMRDRYLWPDTDLEGYRAMQPVLQYRRGPGDWPAVDNPVKTGTAIHGTPDETARRVEGRVRIRGNTGAWAWWTGQVRVVLAPTLPAATRTMTLAGLDRDGTQQIASHGVSDVRQYMRTQMWFTVLDTIRLVLQAPSAQAFEQQWKAFVLPLVRTSGHFSVWVRVIDRLGLNGAIMVPHGTQTLMARFLADVNVAGIYPNTDLQEVP